ncbi:MAG: hypothetical protein JWN78_2630 [Bacteroidota bacterium]|nr:hypothetical protein [Bacteroidota bacterium]
MYIYSVTIHIDKNTEDEWLVFMKEKHIGDVLAAGYFKSCSMRKVLNENDDQHITYNLEYGVETKDDYNAYRQFVAPALQAELMEKFNGKFSAERLFYKIVYETFL